MRRISARQRLVAVTIVLGLLFVGVFFGASGVANSTLSPGQVADPDAPVGDIVKVAGELQSYAVTACVLAEKDGSASAYVLFRVPQMKRSFSPGVVALVKGRLSRPGVIEDAQLVVPSPPSRYRGN